MASDIKIRAQLKGELTEIKCLITHPMETGLRRNEETGEKIPEHFIKEVVCEHNGKKIMTADWGIAIAKNPYLAFRFRGGKAGDSVKVSWSDSAGASASVEARIE
jgi:sulfur-oxidizing protein SoxZ